MEALSYKCKIEFIYCNGHRFLLKYECIIILNAFLNLLRENYTVEEFFIE